MELIRTVKKEKLPVGFSYPVGAEMLSNALKGTSQYTLLEFYFSWKDIYWASKYQAKLKTNGEITILEARYFRGWTIYIHAVPSVCSQKVREKLPLEALPALALALNNADVEPAYFGWRLIYNLANDMLRIEA